MSAKGNKTRYAVLENKSSELTASAWVLQILLSFPNPPAAMYFSESSDSCSMPAVWGYSCIEWDRQGGVCLLHLTQNWNPGKALNRWR